MGPTPVCKYWCRVKAGQLESASTSRLGYHSGGLGDHVAMCVTTARDVADKHLNSFCPLPCRLFLLCVRFFFFFFFFCFFFFFLLLVLKGQVCGGSLGVYDISTSQSSTVENRHGGLVVKASAS